MEDEIMMREGKSVILNLFQDLMFFQKDSGSSPE